MNNPLFRITIYQIVATLIVSTLLWLPLFSETKDQFAGYLWGASALSLLNFILLYWVWRRVFTQKSLGPTFISVIIKYTALVGILWKLSPLDRYSVLFIVLGVLCNTIALVLFGVGINKRKI